ncbi:MAG TPA: DinB family protein [Acidobacteriaceae bacterium]|nr:DinB family protein [Acidobacteriaceae bacterium]
MSQANPYDGFLGERDFAEVLRETPRRVRELAGRLGAAGLERSLEPGKWPARGILCHLADCEIAFGFRLRQTLSVDDHVMQPFDQEKWARSYGPVSGQHAVEVFTALRGWNLALLKGLTPAELDRRASHPQRGEMRLRTIAETMAGHDLNHLQQLEKIAGQMEAGADSAPA